MGSKEPTAETEVGWGLGSKSKLKEYYVPFALKRYLPQ